MPELTIRQATLDDVPLLKRCFDSAYAAYKSKIADLPDVSDGLASEINDKSVWVAELKGGVVGGMVLEVADDYLILENVAVRPSASGSGIGKALISKAETESARVGLHEIRLSTHKDMVGNIALYEHLGWRVVNVEETKVSMIKHLDLSE